MRFPFWYTGEVVFYKSEKNSSPDFIHNLFISNHGTLESKGNYLFQGNKGVFGLRSIVKVQANIEGPTIHIKYFSSLFESNIIFLLGIVLGSFFYLNQKYLFGVVFFIVGLAVYLINTILINSYIKSILKPIGELNQTLEQQELWLKQKEWTKDPDVCSACGEPINPYTIKCVNCGLQFSTKGKKPSTANSTSNLPIKVTYKKDEK